MLWIFVTLTHELTHIVLSTRTKISIVWTNNECWWWWWWWYDAGFFFVMITHEHPIPDSVSLSFTHTIRTRISYGRHHHNSPVYFKRMIYEKWYDLWHWNSVDVVACALVFFSSFFFRILNTRSPIFHLYFCIFHKFFQCLLSLSVASAKECHIWLKIDSGHHLPWYQKSFCTLCTHHQIERACIFYENWWHIIFSNK